MVFIHLAKTSNEFLVSGMSVLPGTVDDTLVRTFEHPNGVIPLCEAPKPSKVGDCFLAPQGQMLFEVIEGGRFIRTCLTSGVCWGNGRETKLTKSQLFVLRSSLVAQLSLKPKIKSFNGVREILEYRSAMLKLVNGYL